MRGFVSAMYPRDSAEASHTHAMLQQAAAAVRIRTARPVKGPPWVPKTSMRPMELTTVHPARSSVRYREQPPPQGKKIIPANTVAHAADAIAIAAARAPLAPRKRHAQPQATRHARWTGIMKKTP